MTEKTARVMERMTTAEVVDVLEQVRTAVIPVGSMEQHGSHLPLGCDTIVIVAVAEEASRRTGCLVAPPLHVSYAGWPHPGTVDLSPSLTADVVTDMGASLIDRGCDTVVILTGHGGPENMTALEDAGARLRNRYPAARVEVPFLWTMTYTYGVLGPQWHDSHGGRCETSFLLHVAPELVHRHPGTDRGNVPDGAFLYDPSRDVNVDDPRQADATLGHRIFEEWVEALCQVIRGESVRVPAP